MNDDEPYENTLSIEQLRREVRECWDRENALIKAIRGAEEMPAPWILKWLGRAAKWPEDNSLGKMLQRKLSSDAIPFKSECEGGAGVWYRIRQGLLAERPQSP